MAKQEAAEEFVAFRGLTFGDKHFPRGSVIPQELAQRSFNWGTLIKIGAVVRRPVGAVPRPRPPAPPPVVSKPIPQRDPIAEYARIVAGYEAEGLCYSDALLKAEWHHQHLAAEATGAYARTIGSTRFPGSRSVEGFAEHIHHLVREVPPCHAG